MDTSTSDYVKIFRQSSPYIHAHRGKTFVIMLSGETLADTHFANIVNDIALLSSLGVRLVLVHGARPQINQRVMERGLNCRFQGNHRITSKSVLECVKEAVGSLRVKIESQFSMGLINSPMHGSRIRVVSGNFVTARPLGVVEGIDFQHTGEVRRIDQKAIVQQLDQGNVVLLSCLGYSATGEVFNLPVENVATSTAARLSAEKLIMFSNQPGILDHDGRILRTMRPSMAREWLEDMADPEGIRLLSAAVEACNAGVNRSHIVSHAVDGSLLQELFTREGDGTLVTRDMDAYEHLRPATINDIGGIIELIRPLEEKGVLVRRSRKALEREIGSFTVAVRDGMIIGCASLLPFVTSTAAELACVVVHPDYRNGNRGDILLEQIEQQAVQQGITHLYVLTTRTAHWFIERGFTPAPLSELPEEKRALYNKDRKSKVFVKPVAITSEVAIAQAE